MPSGPVLGLYEKTRFFCEFNLLFFRVFQRIAWNVMLCISSATIVLFRIDFLSSKKYIKTSIDLLFTFIYFKGSLRPYCINTPLIFRAVGGTGAAGAGQNTCKLRKLFYKTITEPIFKDFQSNGFLGETLKIWIIFFK